MVGHQLWSSTFLPAVYQGTYINTEETDPDKLIQNIRNKSSDARAAARRTRPAGEAEPQPHRSSRAAIRSWRRAFSRPRSPSACRPRRPKRSTSRKETEKTRERYGDSDFGRGCLIARRLVERGVRMVQVYFGNCQPWDNHDDIQIHRKLAAQADPPIARAAAGPEGAAAC